MDATLIVIDSDAELARARALVDRLWDSNDPADIARLEAQARLRGLSMAMVQRLRARLRVPPDLLLPPPKNAPAVTLPGRCRPGLGS